MAFLLTGYFPSWPESLHILVSAQKKLEIGNGLLLDAGRGASIRSAGLVRQRDIEPPAQILVRQIVRRAIVTQSALFGSRIEIDFRPETFLATVKQLTKFLNEAPAVCVTPPSGPAQSHQLSMYHFVQEDHS